MDVREVESSVGAPEFVGRSTTFMDLQGRLSGVARAQRTTLISGPTGSGKDVVARCLHAKSSRRERPYVTVHCGALPEALVEAEMFGHSRGAFTGAMQSRQGLVRSASGGTLFLDEIDSLPPSAQAKLLRFLETGEYRAVGSDHLEHSDAWVIAATNQNLGERVREGAFRADLMYRLAVVELPVPPLQERQVDIRELAEHFLAKVDSKKRFLEDALLAMESYAWPGNVRELKHRVESAALLTESETIDVRALCLGGQGQYGARQQLALADGQGALSKATQMSQPLERQLWELIDGGGFTLAQAIAQCERLLVQAALRAEKNNRTRAAGRLGIHVRTIFKKLRGPESP